MPTKSSFGVQSEIPIKTFNALNFTKDSKLPANGCCILNIGYHKTTNVNAS